MIRPYEVAGMTRALAESVGRASADLTALMGQVSYRQQIDVHAELLSLAVLALDRLAEARGALQLLADSLAELAVPYTCVRCGTTCAAGETHVCPLLPREDQPL
jgi:hypothetical protein